MLYIKEEEEERRRLSTCLFEVVAVLSHLKFSVTAQACAFV